MFGATGIADDSDDESGGKFAPKYASYNLSKGMAAGKFICCDPIHK